MRTAIRVILRKQMLLLAVDVVVPVVLDVALVMVSLVVVLSPSEPTVFLNNRTMVWVSQNSQFPALKEVLMLKNISHGS
jgi:hypothetical protein